MKFLMNFRKKDLIKGVIGISFLVLSTVFYFVLNNYKHVEVTLDGKKKTVITRQLFVKGLTDKIMKNNTNYIITSNINQYRLLAPNDKIEISTIKSIDITLNGETKKIFTYKDTIKELFKELKIDEKSNFIEGLELNALLTDHTSLKIIKKEVKTIEETIEEILPVTYSYNNSKNRGHEAVLDEGSPKKIVKTYEIIYNDGIEVSKTLKNEQVIDNGRSKVIEIGNKVVQVSYTGSIPMYIWDQLAKCESGGNWNINTGNGYYGGLQFDYSTWISAAKATGITTTRADYASKEEQIIVASYLQSQRGWYPWPSCARSLGLIP